MILFFNVYLYLHSTMPLIESTPSDEVNVFILSIFHKLSLVTGSESPMVCRLNKQLLIETHDLLREIILEMDEYILSKMRLCVESTQENLHKLLDQIDRVRSTHSYYIIVRDKYRQIIDNYDEFLADLSEEERMIAHQWSIDNPVKVIREL